MNAYFRWVAWLRWSLANIFYVLGILALMRRRRARRGDVPVLLFHRVAGTVSEPQPRAFPVNLFHSLVIEASRRYDLCTPATAVGRRSPMVLTFDDGYADQAETTWPLVKSVGGTALFFITRGDVGEEHRFWWDLVAWAHREAPSGGQEATGFFRYPKPAADEMEKLKQVGADQLAQRVRELEKAAGGVPLPFPVMTGAQVRRLVDEGAQIGGHGVAHVSLKYCTDAVIDEELAGTRRFLDQLSGGGDCFAYPSGEFDERVVTRLGRTGFRWAFTTRQAYWTKADPLLQIPRIAPTPAMCSPDGRHFSWALFEAELLGVFSLWRTFRQAIARRVIGQGH